MFVAIDNIEMNIPKVTEWIIKSRDASGGVISPDFAMEVLSKTNHFGHIKMVLKNIKEKCNTPEKIAPYREFLLSCLDRREMSEQAMDMLKEMAGLCGCEEKLMSTNKEPKLYNKIDCGVVIVKSKEELNLLEGEDIKVLFDADVVDLKWCDLSKIKNIKFGDEAYLNLENATNLPEVMDFSMSSSVSICNANFEGVKEVKFRDGAYILLDKFINLPSNFDVSMCDSVGFFACKLNEFENIKFKEGANISFGERAPYKKMEFTEILDLSMFSRVFFDECDLSKVKELKFREGANVEFYNNTDLPEVLDVSMCSKVIFNNCEFNNVEELKLGEVTDVVFRLAKNLPKDLDFTQCPKVDIMHCSLSGGKVISFKEGADVTLANVHDFPEVVDVSKCSKAMLYYSDFSGVKEVKFGSCAKVDLTGAKNLPEVLDLSMCSEVILEKCNLTGVKEIKFKDKEQEAKFMVGAKKFAGKAVYAGEENKVNILPGNGGMGM